MLGQLKNPPDGDGARSSETFDGWRGQVKHSLDGDSGAIARGTTK